MDNIKASDQDKGCNAKINYTIISGEYTYSIQRKYFSLLHSKRVAMKKPSYELGSMFDSIWICPVLKKIHSNLWSNNG